MVVSDLVHEAHQQAKKSGWYDLGARPVPEVLMMIVSEAVEALDEYRDGHDIHEIRYRKDGKPEGFPVELADIVIRIADFCGHLGIDLGKVVEEKMAYNRTRPYRHGGKKC